MGIKDILVFVLPVLLGMQYFNYALANARGGEKPKPGTYMKGALLFALSGVILLVAGYFFAGIISGYVAGRELYVSMVMLLLISVRIITGVYKNRARQRIYNIESNVMLLGMAVAFSINQLFAGVAVKLLNGSIASNSKILGISTLIFALSGFVNANRFSYNQGKIVESLSGIGIMLVALGLYLI